MVNSTWLPALGIAPNRCSVKTVTSDRFAECGTHGNPGPVGHLRDLQAPREAAHVAHVGLGDVERLHAEHPPPLRQVVVLLAPGHRDLQRRRHLGRPFQFPVRAGLLEVAVAVLSPSSRPTSMAFCGV